MEPGQPHNIAIAEINHNGGIARITGTAMSEDDDAIQFIVDLMAQEGIMGDKVLKLHSERQPSPEWYEYFAKHWPNVAVTWNFGPGEDVRMEAEIGKLLANPSRPWWKFW